MKLTVRISLGESFLVFWNVFMTFAENDYNISELENDANQFSLQDNKLSVDCELRHMLDEHDNRRYNFTYNGDENVPIAFIVSPCKRVDNVWWTLKHTNGRINVDGSIYTTLMKYSGDSHETYIGNATRGVYTLDVGLRKSAVRFMYSIYVTLQPNSIQLLREIKYNNHERSIFFEKNVVKQSLLVEWPHWSWDDKQAYYFIAICTKDYLISACQYDHLYHTTIVEESKVYTSKYEMIKRAIPGETYYVSVFVFTDDYSYWPYLQGNITFPKTRRIGLKDGMPTKVKITADDYKLAFRYKIRNHQLADSHNEILWYVISCAGPIFVEINHKKDAIVQRQLVRQHKMFKIPKPKIGRRYVMKITPVDDMQDGGSVEVMATMRRKYFSLPNVTNFTVTSVPNLDYREPDRASFLIAWKAALNKKPISYCIYYRRLLFVTDEHIRPVSYCERNVEIRNMHQYCFERRVNSSIVTEFINDLDPLADYLVYVSARKPPHKQKIWYDSLIIYGKNSHP